VGAINSPAEATAITNAMFLMLCFFINDFVQI